jgi:phosphonate degradation associated HDIG domain protein
MTAVAIDDVLALYDRWGADHYDEDLSQRDHALQTAALALAAGASDALIVAALLHDIGHLLALQTGSQEGSRPVDLRHEASGARYLAGLFPSSVTGPIALHVRAKRYRCAVDHRYWDQLSAGSKRSLEVQGGPMTDDEAATFELLPGFANAVRLREWDDQGKVDGLDVVPLAAYRGHLERVAAP